MSILKHAERVHQAANSDAVLRSTVAASWARAIKVHGLDPGSERQTRRLDGAALKRRQKRLERFLSVAAPKLDGLYNAVGLSGCGVLLTDSQGVVVDQRCSDPDIESFEAWGLGLGTDWSEASEGTNGIGTCIAETRSVIVHTDEHFRARNTGLSCMDAPIFGIDGTVIAALDVSSARSDKTEKLNSMISALVMAVARQIEADYFHSCFAGCKIIALPHVEQSAPVLVATDDHELVVGATRIARKRFNLGFERQVRPIPVSDLIGGGDQRSVFGDAETSAIMTALARTHGNITKAARQCGIGRATFYRRMNRLGIDKTAFKDSILEGRR